MSNHRAAAAAILITLGLTDMANAAGPLGGLLEDDEVVDLTIDYFVGTWGMGSADACLDSDTMAFYRSGAWAVTNAGGNPVEAIGVWSIDHGVLVVEFSELRDPDHTETATGEVGSQTETQFNLATELVGDGEEIMFRCSE